MEIFGFEGKVEKKGMSIYRFDGHYYKLAVHEMDGQILYPVNVKAHARYAALLPDITLLKPDDGYISQPQAVCISDMPKLRECLGITQKAIKELKEIADGIGKGAYR